MSRFEQAVDRRAAVERFERAEMGGPARRRRASGAASRLRRRRAKRTARRCERAPRSLATVWRSRQHAADRGERLQMVGAGIGRRQQQEDEVDRHAVDRLEVDRRRQPGEIAEHALSGPRSCRAEWRRRRRSRSSRSVRGLPNYEIPRALLSTACSAQRFTLTFYGVIYIAT